LRKTIFSTDFSEIFRTRPNASERIQTHPSPSERIRTGPGRSQQVRKLKKTCKNLRKLQKNCENLAKILARRLVFATDGSVSEERVSVHAMAAKLRRLVTDTMPASSTATDAIQPRAKQAASRNFFQNFSRSFRKFFASFRKLFEGFGLALTCWDLLGCIRMHLDAFGCVRTLSEKIRKI